MSNHDSAAPEADLPLPAPVASGWRAIRRNPSAALLAVQLVSLLVYPFFDRDASSTGRSMVALFGLLALAATTRLVASTPWTFLVSVVIGVPAVVLTVIDALTGWAQPWHFWSDVSHLLFYIYAAIALLVYIFTDDHITVDELFAVAAAFTLAMWAFAHGYSALQHLQPGSFTAAVDPDGPRSWMELLFLSCTTLTSTGLSDVVPIRPVARAAVMVQQLAGVFYIAMAISRVMALTVARQRRVA